MTTLEAAYQYIDRTLNPDGIADLGRDGLAVIMAGFADDQRAKACAVCGGTGQITYFAPGITTANPCPSCGGKTP